MTPDNERISVCVLCYGDYPQLARQCLLSIWDTFKYRDIADLRIGLNACSAGTRGVVDHFAELFAGRGRPVWLYIPNPPALNVYKYPLMRRMFYDEQRPLVDWVMWFDDDAFLTQEAAADDWWQELQSIRVDSDLLGQPMVRHVWGNQLAWITTQPWYNPVAGPPPTRKIGGKRRPTFMFMQGSWWLMRAAAIRRINWPIPELRHCGGDALLGEICRHVGLRCRRFERGVRFNAGVTGRNSRSPRRGHNEPLIGSDYRGQALSTNHHVFDHLVREIAFPC